MSQTAPPECTPLIHFHGQLSPPCEIHAPSSPPPPWRLTRTRWSEDMASLRCASAFPAGGVRFRLLVEHLAPTDTDDDTCAADDACHIWFSPLQQSTGVIADDVRQSVIFMSDGQLIAGGVRAGSTPPWAERGRAYHIQAEVDFELERVRFVVDGVSAESILPVSLIGRRLYLHLASTAASIRLVAHQHRTKDSSIGDEFIDDAGDVTIADHDRVAMDADMDESDGESMLPSGSGPATTDGGDNHSDSDLDLSQPPSVTNAPAPSSSSPTESPPHDGSGAFTFDECAEDEEMLPDSNEVDPKDEPHHSHTTDLPASSSCASSSSSASPAHGFWHRFASRSLLLDAPTAAAPPGEFSFADSLLMVVTLALLSLGAAHLLGVICRQVMG